MRHNERRRMHRNFVFAMYATLFFVQLDSTRRWTVHIDSFTWNFLSDRIGRAFHAFSAMHFALCFGSPTGNSPFAAHFVVHRERLTLALTRRVEYYTTRFERWFACIRTRGHASIFHGWCRESILNSFIQFFHVLSDLPPGYKQWCLIASQHLHGYANLYRSIQSRSTQEQ